MNLDTADQVAETLKVSRETMRDLNAYVKLTKKWTKKINLIGKSTVQHIWSRHIADSLQIVQHAGKNPTSWVDIGSGAGFPGLVAAIALKDAIPKCHFTLIDSDLRKCLFLKTVIRELNLNVDVKSERIQNIGHFTNDIVSARALAPLSDLLTMSEPLLAKHGTCLFLKGSDVDSELTAASQSWNMNLERIPSVTDPNGVILKIGDLARV